MNIGILGVGEVGSAIKKLVERKHRVFTIYEPLKTFSYIGGTVFLGGIFLGTRYVYFNLLGKPGNHLQSLLLAAVLLIVGFQIFLIGLVADLIAANRKLMEKILEKLIKL